MFEHPIYSIHGHYLNVTQNGLLEIHSRSSEGHCAQFNDCASVQITLAVTGSLWK